MKSIILLIPCIFLTLLNVFSQNYHAVHGSSYAGALGVSNNPASIVNVSDAWDITPLSLQYEISTNAVSVLNYSLISSPKNSKYYIDNGNYSRYVSGNFNFRLFNTRVALDRRHAIAAGMNLRGNIHAKTGKYNFIDTVNTLRSFLKVNNENQLLEGKFNTNSWLEVFGTYSQTMWDNEISRLNGGITIKAMRGIAAAFGSLHNIGFTRIVQGNQPFYFLQTGNTNYAYSANLDKWQSRKSTSRNIQDVVVSAEGSIAFDIGMEYLIKSQAVNTFYDDDNYYDYEWKIGISLLDIGSTHYRYSPQSRSIGSEKENVADRILQRKFNAPSIPAFNDSIAGIFSNVQSLAVQFSVINPARLVVNVDRNLYDNFYLNGELSANLSALAGKEKLYATQLNVLTITPRWETRRYGVYLPVQFNAENQFWVGMAFKAGPVLFGVHNLGNVVAKNKIQNGGVYLAFSVRPGNRTKSFRDKRNNCPQ